MEEKLNSEQMKLLSGMMGAEGSDALRMMERIDRLRRLFGNTETQKSQEIQTNEASVPESPFGSDRGENILFSAIPFLDLEFQKNIFVIARLMELRRVLDGTKLEVRERQEDPAFRRHNMLRAVRPFLKTEEKAQIDSMLKIMEVKDILARKEGQ
ncbi:hypothetical protein [Anaerotignum sp. MB30-C6]|uniref:hypothetical protein n=1 Tax=Anaerotignum sp. MB30-C6 TaxID=3070814 RepID=UPI0027DC8DC7|nr:hypothetical protein [Anaerotignum sp. MB30-C6]WMI81287.1 hypothetical protein RBQ60_00720 [Anaerotignum sp. MB30-C6]